MHVHVMRQDVMQKVRRFHTQDVNLTYHLEKDWSSYHVCMHV